MGQHHDRQQYDDRSDLWSSHQFLAVRDRAEDSADHHERLQERKLAEMEESVIQKSGPVHQVCES